MKRIYFKLIPTLFLVPVIMGIIFVTRNKWKRIDFFGRKIGALKFFYLDFKSGIEFLCHPIESVRYFEFDYVLNKVNEGKSRILDVSSPRLISLFLSKKFKKVNIHMINPDLDDLRVSNEIIKSLDIKNISTHYTDLQRLHSVINYQFDLIYSISVLEHISGEFDDIDAIEILQRYLLPGGKLIITVPVDRIYREEYSNFPLYGTQPIQPNGSYFFQRIYDYETLKNRLIKSSGLELVEIKWFGETKVGSWERYRNRQAKLGLIFNVFDPIYMKVYFNEYEGWNEMPGFGICGLTFKKK